MSKPRVHVGRCASSIRHWFTVYGSVGARRAICGHCRAIHPDVVKALERGLYYARLYVGPSDAPDSQQNDRRQARDIRMLEGALERVRNERRA